MSPPPTLWCVADDVPAETLDLLAAAARAQGLGWQVVRPGDPRPWPAAGDLLYRPAVSPEAMALERALWRPDLRSFWTTPDGPLAVPAFPPALLERAGLRTPRWADLPSAAPAALDAAVAAVGPPPWVVKIPGHAGGHGVFQVDSRPGLASLAGYLLAEGQVPWLMAWTAGVHWRVVVAGDAAVAAYPNPVRRGDFRTDGTDDPHAVLAEVPARLAEPALAACAAMGVAHGGVDLLVPSAGPPAILETNFPCYFAHAEILAGVPVAATMVRALARGARPAPPAPCAPAAGGPVWLIEDEGAPYNAALLSAALEHAGREARRLPVQAGRPDAPTPGPVICAGWSVGAWRLASALGGVPAHAPSLLALTDGVSAGATRWRALWVGDALLACDPVDGAPAPTAAVRAAARAAAARARRPWLQIELSGEAQAPVARGLYHPPDLASFAPEVARAAAAARAALTPAPPRPTLE